MKKQKSANKQSTVYIIYTDLGDPNKSYKTFPHMYSTGHK